MRNVLSTFAWTTALLACAPEEPERGIDQGDGDGDGESSDSGESSGDGDGDGDSAESSDGAQAHGPDPICDLSRFVQLEMIWLDKSHSLVPDALPTVIDLAVTPKHMFVAGLHDANEPERRKGFVERRELNGALDWIKHDADVHGLATIWDGKHLYGMRAARVRRWTADGMSDPWWIEVPTFAGMAVGHGEVLIASNDEELVPDGPDPRDFDTSFAAFGKQSPAGQLQDGSFDDPDFDHRTQAITHASWGGWIAAIATDEPDNGPLFLTDYGDPNFHVVLDVDPTSRVVAMHTPANALMVLANVPQQPVWIIGVSDEGEQLWRKDHWLCDGVEGALVDVIDHKGTIWALAWVRTNHGKRGYLLVRFGHGGQLVSVRAIPIDSEYYGLNAVDLTTTSAYLGGWISDGVDRRRVLGRVDW